jgi:MFS transporter, OPA family, sugar phosphate sensor protein UhpC
VAYRYRWVILTFGILAYTTSYFARSNYTGIAKFVSADFHLDKGALGLLGSVFLYAYALAQLPWGFASDRWGSRIAIGIGVFLTGATLWGFSSSASFNQLLFWRVANGIAAASIYVVMAGALARWFAPRERGFAQSLFAAVGGSVGEGTANLVVPYLAIHVASGWRQSTNILATVIVLIAVACAAFHRSAPPGQPTIERKPFDWSLLKTAPLWCFTFVYSGSIIALRVLPTWLPIYAADIYLSKGLKLEDAVIAGGALSTLYLAGRFFGCPITGFVSDRLLARGISRTALGIGFVLVTGALFQTMPVGIHSTVALGFIAFGMGVSINMYPLITTAVSEALGEQRTSSIMGFVNMVAQLGGASALLLSGYLGIALSSNPGNALAEYRGIWLVGLTCCAATAAGGIVLSLWERTREARVRVIGLSKS